MEKLSWSSKKPQKPRKFSSVKLSLFTVASYVFCLNCHWLHVATYVLCKCNDETSMIYFDLTNSRKSEGDKENTAENM